MPPALRGYVLERKVASLRSCLRTVVGWSPTVARKQRGGAELHGRKEGLARKEGRCVARKEGRKVCCTEGRKVCCTEGRKGGREQTRTEGGACSVLFCSVLFQVPAASLVVRSVAAAAVPLLFRVPVVVLSSFRPCVLWLVVGFVPSSMLFTPTLPQAPQLYPSFTPSLPQVHPNFTPTSCLKKRECLGTWAWGEGGISSVVKYNMLHNKVCRRPVGQQQGTFQALRWLQHAVSRVAARCREWTKSD